MNNAKSARRSRSFVSSHLRARRDRVGPPWLLGQSLQDVQKPLSAFDRFDGSSFVHERQERQFSRSLERLAIDLIEELLLQPFVG